MATIGFHASHEQIGPAPLLAAVQAAERAGFQAAMCSDHVNPWSVRQGHSGHAWPWLGAALATTGLPFGVVTAPGERYQPAETAQAIATLASMFPGRFWAALGSGENLNESITGQKWPLKETRQRRLEECADIIRRLLGGEEVTHHGLVQVERARVWDAPADRPDLFVPALTDTTAARMAGWADGLITINQAPETLRRILGAYREAGGAGPAALQVHLSWAPDDDEAQAVAMDQWQNNALTPPLTADLPTTEHFDVAGQGIRPDQVRRSVLVSADLGQQVAWLQEFADLGFDRLYLHHVGQEQQRFIDTFGEHVLPQLGAQRARR